MRGDRDESFAFEGPKAAGIGIGNETPNSYATAIIH
jgi:hypothetical protein